MGGFNQCASPNSLGQGTNFQKSFQVSFPLPFLDGVKCFWQLYWEETKEQRKERVEILFKTGHWLGGGLTPTSPPCPQVISWQMGLTCSGTRPWARPGNFFVTMWWWDLASSETGKEACPAWGFLVSHQLSVLWLPPEFLTPAGAWSSQPWAELGGGDYCWPQLESALPKKTGFPQVSSLLQKHWLWDFNKKGESQYWERGWGVKA